MTPESSTRPAIVTIGNFDGVHLGHQKLIQQTVDRASALGLCSLAVTFEPHPEQVLFPERRLTHLSSIEERLEVLQASGLDHVWVCPFTPELARLEPAEFMRMVADRQPLAELWVGADFALGKDRRGTISVLSEIGTACGWGLHVVPPYMLEGQIVSSTAIRTLLAAGAVRGAADLLGRPYSVRGQLHGAEVEVDLLRTLPRAGAYEAQLHQDDAVYDALVTVHGSPARINIDTDLPTQDAPATVIFLRRAD
jgi:riboflavin kinase / FMN adenylyltransferase